MYCIDQDKVQSLEGQVSLALQEAQARAGEAARAQGDVSVATADLVALQVRG
jgi:hypothetical protein